MTDDQHAVQIDLAMKGVSVGSVPAAKLLEVFKMNDSPSSVLAKVKAIQKVHVDGGSDDPVGCQQLTQVQIAGRRVY